MEKPHYFYVGYTFLFQMIYITTTKQTTLEKLDIPFFFR